LHCRHDVIALFATEEDHGFFEGNLTSSARVLEKKELKEAMKGYKAWLKTQPKKK
jgi:hypothetical protein